MIWSYKTCFRKTYRGKWLLFNICTDFGRAFLSVMLSYALCWLMYELLISLGGLTDRNKIVTCRGLCISLSGVCSALLKLQTWHYILLVIDVDVLNITMINARFLTLFYCVYPAAVCVPWTNLPAEISLSPSSTATWVSPRSAPSHRTSSRFRPPASLQGRTTASASALAMKMGTSTSGWEQPPRQHFYI